MTDKEMLQEALEWQEHIKMLANGHADDELYQKRSKVFDWLIEQAERVQELEIEVNDWRNEVKKWQRFYKESEESHLETKVLLRSTLNQNKRYREYLELIRKTGIQGRIISTGEIIRSKEANLAEEALEGEK